MAEITERDTRKRTYVLRAAREAGVRVRELSYRPPRNWTLLTEDEATLSVNDHVSLIRAIQNMGPPMPPLPALARKRVDRTAGPLGCWLWIGSVNASGYGKFHAFNLHKTFFAHRAMYEASVGPIPPKMTIDHLCRQKLCINPAHLEVVTAAENVRRYAESISAACRRGHPKTEEYGKRDRKGSWVCASCKRLTREIRIAARRGGHG
jgi:hypothetical protein